MTRHWRTTRFAIVLARPLVMGVVNVTPDSFSDGGEHATARDAFKHCEQLINDGADMLDIGGESSRPGAAPLPLANELARVLPVVRAAVRLGVPVSVDTYKPEVMQAVLDEGADIINDIWAFRQPGAREVVARYPQCGLVLMHMHRSPLTMQTAPMDCVDVVTQVKNDLLSFCELLAQYSAGLGADSVDKNRIVIDPGIGFGKTVAQNFALLSRQQELASLGYPILAGWSRKSSLGAVTGLDAAQRMVPSVAAALLAVERGASIVRVHDVRETVQALKVWQAVQGTHAVL
jgi:dihydropteroate synthase